MADDNRELEHGIHLKDCYQTPRESLEDFARVVLRSGLGRMETDDPGAPLGRVLDPCSGDDRRFRSVLGPWASSWEDNEWRRVGLDGVTPVDADTHHDFLRGPWGPGDVDTVVANPPFSLFLEFARHALVVASKRVILVSRIATMAGQERYWKLWSSHPPAMFLPQSRRPSFSGDRKTDKAQEYMWTWWNVDQGGGGLHQQPVVIWIPPDGLPPGAER